MNTTSFFPAAFLSAALFAGSTFSSPAQGMPPEARENLHRLFDQHKQIERKVTLSETGYSATTTSTNPVLVRALQAHVKQMNERLESGLMVRRWDPAFAEYVAFYSDMNHKFTKIPNGIKATVTGKTPEAIRVAQNHAQVIADFAAHGWEAHDRSHPAVVDASVDKTAPASEMKRCENCRAGTEAKDAGCDCGGTGNGPMRGKGPRGGR